MKYLSSKIEAFPFIFRVGLILVSSVGFNAHADNYVVDNTIAYDFVDVSASGNVVLSDCDDCVTVVDLGFPFTYYGRTFERLFISSNGFVSLGIGANSSGCCHGRDIDESNDPDDDDDDVATDEFAGVLAPWWGDLSMAEPFTEDSEGNVNEDENGVALDATPDIAESDGRVITQLNGSAGSYEFIVQYDQVRHFFNASTDDANTFQIKLKQVDNSIEFHYQKIVDNRSVHTIGIESPRQDQGVKYFRTSSLNSLPSPSETFALRFVPPEENRIESSKFFASDSNKQIHTFSIADSITSANDFLLEDIDIDSDSIVLDVDPDSLNLISLSPISFSLLVEVDNNLSSEATGAISGQNISVTLNGDTTYNFDSQLVYVSTANESDIEGVSVNGVAMNAPATIKSFKTTSDILENGKDESLNDIFFSGPDADTLVPETHQLTNLVSNTDKCGLPYIDSYEDINENTVNDLYALCDLSGGTQAVALYRFDLNSYLDDEIDEFNEIVTGSDQVFSGDLETSGLVVAAKGNIAYVRDTSASNDFQDVFYNGVKVSTETDASVSALAISSEGDRLVYVIGNKAFVYMGGVETRISTASNSSYVDISGDGSTIAFDSNQDLAVGNNTDSSVEIYSTAVSSPYVEGAFIQRTNLPAGKVCKLPQLTESAERLAVVCNDDLLNADNDFVQNGQGREAVFLLESKSSGELVHLLSSGEDSVSVIDRMKINDTGERLNFQQGGSEVNSFFIIGMGNVKSAEQVASTQKAYPVATVLPGDGKSGYVSFLMMTMLLCVSCVRFFRKH